MPTDEMASDPVVPVVVMALLGSSCDVSRDEAHDDGALFMARQSLS